ncbi:ferredoxin [Clostridium tetani]|uniref:Ferredoxin n=1 Tax=Clostridium tetani TaxID=1513 RepID=A0A4Q0VCQ0_CLOTA|nr:ferredoxin [Clostridium tetani]CDI48305.1 ferredoxin [Clostridium tetani 12124569]AVP55435.1 ferredoxin [Clostridium tetani]KGI36427.1 ferredoxin [Clostridium tetani]KGI37274.1 ferredoxin [Clostridium tetani ATCC 9441]KGI44558.1 ferredoxin [Clostridium tetani]
MKAYVDKEACIGCGLCPSVASEVFEMDDDGKAKAITEDVPKGSEDLSKEAEASCPTAAISVEE